MAVGLKNPWKLVAERNGYRYYQNNRTQKRIAQKHIDYHSPPGEKDHSWLNTGHWSDENNNPVDNLKEPR